MELEIVRWARVHGGSEIASDLFQEAERCYLSKAYRASYIFSYLGILEVLRNRIQRAARPTTITDEHWQGIIRRISNEESWDSAVFDLVRDQGPRRVFEVSSDLRDQFLFWKGRRNDCSHSKSNTISYAHTEALWAFIVSNLHKFSIVGSVEELLSKILDHYDPSKTQPGKNPDYLTAAARNTVPRSEIASFLETLDNLLANVQGEDRRGEFFAALAEQGDGDFQSELERFITGRVPLLMAVISSSVQTVHLLRGNPPLVRQIWYSTLHDTVGIDRLAIFTAMLRNCLIPPAELEEAMERVCFKMRGFRPSSDHVAVLREYGFFPAFQKAAYEEYKINDFGWGNSNAAMVIFDIEHNGLSATSVTAISQTFSSAYHPWTLVSRLKSHVNGHAARPS